MSGEDEEKIEDRDSKDDDAMRALLKRASDAGSAQAPEPDLLRGVQKKLRTRSKGKFYADGWSTSQSRINYGLVAVAMLIVIAVAYFALGPMGITAH
jgi:hypothetical protein